MQIRALHDIWEQYFACFAQARHLYWRAARSSDDVEWAFNNADHRSEGITAMMWPLAAYRAVHGSEADLQWLRAALREPESDKPLFVSCVTRQADAVPSELFDDMLLAAVRERRANVGRAFVLPCVRSEGLNRVNRQLLTHLVDGTDFERIGAARAIQWVNSISEGRDKASESTAVQQQQRGVMLQLFVEQNDRRLRRELIDNLPLRWRDRWSYPRWARKLRNEAIGIALGSLDEHLHNQVRVQLGTLASSSSRSEQLAT